MQKFKQTNDPFRNRIIFIFYFVPFILHKGLSLKKETICSCQKEKETPDKGLEPLTLRYP